MQVTFTHSREEAPDIRTFFFEPEKPLAYTAGQFIELNVIHDQPDARGTKRWFTLSSSPTEGELAITTRLRGIDGSSFKQALFNLKKGDVAQVTGPMGDFVLPKFVQTPLIFVAAGIGVSPFRSILTWLHDTGEHRPIKFVYAVRTEDDIIFTDTFDKAKQHVTVVVLEPTPAWGGERGRVTAEMIVGLEHPSDNTLLYLSGPEILVDGLYNDLLTAGINKAQIVTDRFSGYTAA